MKMTGRRLFWNSFVFVFLYERICGSTQGTGRAVCVGGGRGGEKGGESVGSVVVGGFLVI